MCAQTKWPRPLSPIKRLTTRRRKRNRHPLHRPFQYILYRWGNLDIISPQYTETANGSTSYSFTGLVVNKQNTPVRAAGITCKIWLTKDGNVNSVITDDRLQSASTLDLPFPKEAQGTLIFAASTPQTQMCHNGQAKWSYQIAPTTETGQYYIVLLTDWNGIHYNWSWVKIRDSRASLGILPTIPRTS